MISRIFRSVFFSTILVLFLGLCASIILSSYVLLRSDIRALCNYADSLANILNADVTHDLSLLDINTYRITLIHKNGVVYYDSKLKPSIMENHSDRVEFKEAIEKGKSEFFRYSSSLNTRTIYCAVLLESGDVLRCSDTSGNILSDTLSLSMNILIIFPLAIVFSLFLAHHLSKHIVNPINNIDLNNPTENVVYEELNPLLSRIDSHQHQIKKLLRTVTSSHYQMKAMTSNMSEGIIFLNKNGEIILINESAKQNLGIRDEKVIGKSLKTFEFFAPLKSIYDERRNCSLYKTEIELSGKFFNLIFNTISGKTHLIGYVFLFVDITQSKLLQQQKQDFAANVSHELKTPLQSIIGRAELIENGIVKTEDLKSFCSKIKSEGESLLSMINDIMFLSRIESGVKCASEEVDLKALAENVIESLQAKARFNNVTLSLESESVFVTCVRRYMKEILTGLIDNGIKYNKENGSVRTAISRYDGKLLITVSDTGIGIPQADLGRIYERFFCVDRSHSNKDSTGLGLTIIKHIVDRCGGSIEVESVPGKGTSFHIIFDEQLLS